VLPISCVPTRLELFVQNFADVFRHAAQRLHLGEYLAGLISSGNRTVAGIHQRTVGGTEYDSLHHFMTDSTWKAEEVREKRLQWIRSNLPAEEAADGPRVIAIDSLFCHHTGEDIFGVYYYWDYVQKKFCRAQRVVISCLVTPSKLIPLGRELYHRGFLPEQKLYLEATKPSADATESEMEDYEGLVKQYEDNIKEHKSQIVLAGELVDECERLGFHKDAYVLDGAFLDKDLMSKIDLYGQAWITRLAKSRLVQAATGRYITIGEFAKTLPKESFKEVKVKTRHGEPRTYWVFTKCMMLKQWEKHRIVISYDNKDLEGEPYFLITNKKNWNHAQRVLQNYMMRDPIEHLIRDDKQELGFEDNQQRKEKAVLNHWELTFVAHAFLELGFNVSNSEGVPGPKLETTGQRCRYFEMELLQGFINQVKRLALEPNGTEELFNKVRARRLNRLAH